MQQLPLLSVGVGLAWLVQRFQAGPPGRTPDDAGANAHEEENQEVDFEKRATQWLARKAVSVGGTTVGHASTYSEVELLVDGELVYLRSGSNILTALVPTVRQLSLQPLQLTKGKPDAVPTAPLDPNSVWLVRRNKQEVVFKLLGPHGLQHVLEADPGSPHGVSLGGAHANRRGRWRITPQGLTSARWPQHVLPLQVLAVHLVDARAVGVVKASLGKQLAEQTTRAERDARERAQAEAGREQLQAQLDKAHRDSEAQMAELRAALDAATRSRHAAERELSALQVQRTDETTRAKAAQSKAVQAEHEARQLAASVRQLQKQMQGLLAEHSEELVTLRQELQIAREANENLQRAMGEQALALSGALELRDARILELEEENERMDTVLQVIQAQLGGGSLTLAPPSAPALPRVDPAPADGQEPAAGNSPFEVANEEGAAAVNAEGGGVDAGPAHGDRTLVALRESQAGQAAERRSQRMAGAGSPLPLWRSLLDLPGGLSVAALKESLAISRRNTTESALAIFPSAEPAVGKAEPGHSVQASQCIAVGEQASSTQPAGPHGGGPAASAAASALRAWPCILSPDGASSVGSSDGRELAVWGSRDRDMNLAGGGGGSGLGDGEDEEEFVSAAARMGATARMKVPSTGRALFSPSVSSSAQDLAARGADGAAASGTGRVGISASAGAPCSAVTCAAGSGSGAAAGSQLQCSTDAMQTLDSLRRRIRALQSEQKRLHELSCSLECSLPWRAGEAAGGPAGPHNSRGGGPAHSSGARAGEAGYGGGASVAASDRRRTLDSSVSTSAVKGWLAAAEAVTAGADWAGARRADAPGGCSEAGCGADHIDGRASAKRHRVDSASGAGSGSADSSPVSKVLSIVRQLSSDSGDGSAVLSPAKCRRSFGNGASCGSAKGNAASAAESTPDSGPISRSCEEVTAMPQLSNGGSEGITSRSPGHGGSGGPIGRSGTSHNSTGGHLDTSLSGSGSSSGTPDSSRRVQKAGGSSRAGLQFPCAPAQPWAAGARAAPAAAPGAGRWVPELRLNRPAIANGTDSVYGVSDSIDVDGMCNLGSTRAAPTARGAGMLTARHFSHSRRPSAGAGGALGGEVPLVSPTHAGRADAASAAAAPGNGAASVILLDGPDGPEDPDGRPLTPAKDRMGAASPPAAATPPAAAAASRLAMTPKSQAGDAGEDDAAVHCDDQEGSPPVAMLFGPLEALRSAAGAGSADREGGGGLAGGLRAGKRVLAALEEEEDDDA